jgi:hypothetical protein
MFQYKIYFLEIIEVFLVEVWSVNVNLSGEFLTEVIYTSCSKDVDGSKSLVEQGNGAEPIVALPKVSVWLFLPNS